MDNAMSGPRDPGSVAPFPGYPARLLTLDTPGLRSMGGGVMHVPAGPWHVAGHPNRRGVDPALLDPDVPEQEPGLSATHTQRWRTLGLDTDQHGRPLHPDWRRLLAGTGLPTGVGFFYRYGPNVTVDPVVYRYTAQGWLEFLLIRRRDGRGWALPGGFSDPQDVGAVSTARRELAEETGLTVHGRAETIIRTRPTGGGGRTTLHAWTENIVVLIHGDPAYLHHAPPVAGSDAAEAAWATLADIADLTMFDQHARYIRAAARRLPRLA